MQRRLIDTDILSEFLKQKNPTVLTNAQAYLVQHRRFSISSILIIAATAMEHDRILVTGNASDFIWIAGLTIEDWRSSAPI